MTWWPGWDSIANTGWWSHFWFWFGIACLFALGASEIVSHVYGLRKDQLVAAAETATAIQRKTDSDGAETRRKAETEALQKQLAAAEKAAAEAREKANQVEARQADRRLTDEQKGALRAAVSAYPGQKARISVLAGDNEAFRYAREFGDILHAAGWDVGGGIVQDFYTGAVPQGIQATVFSQQSVPGNTSVPVEIGTLILALQKMGLIKGLLSDPGVPNGTLYLRVGPK
jgi:hypothetical protein